jgi:hypothetical protein
MTPKHTVGTVVRLRDGDLFLITKHNPNKPKNCYSGVNVNGNGTEYIFGEINIVEAIPGYDASRVRLPQDKHDPTYARRQAERGSMPDRPKWAVLADLKPGDKFRARMRAGVQEVTLTAVNPNAPRYPVEVNDAKGRGVRLSLGCVVVPPGMAERLAEQALVAAETLTSGDVGTIEASDLTRVEVGSQYDLLVMDTCETFTVDRIAFTPFGPMARLLGPSGHRFVLVDDLANNCQM